MTSPYINTRLYSKVPILPGQMNNDISSHMKVNLSKKIEEKCFKNFGYISKIYKILEYGDGVIEPENPMSAAIYKVKFTCRLCLPLKNSTIICKVSKTNAMLTSVFNGPIRVVITYDRINKDNFAVGKTGLLVKTNIGSRTLDQNDLVRVKIDSRKFNDGDSIIMCMGILEQMATQDDARLFARDEFNTDNEDKYIDYDKYISAEDKANNLDSIGDATVSTN